MNDAATLTTAGPALSDLAKLKADRWAAMESHATFRTELDLKLAELDRQIQALQILFKEDNAELIAAESETANEVAALDLKLRRAVVAHYLADMAAAGGDANKVSKQRGEGLSVQVRTRFQYANSVAVAWAEKNAPFLIETSVHEKQFEAAMKSLQKDGKLPEFVQVISTPTAVIKD